MACLLGAHFRIAKFVAHSVLTVRLVGGHGTGSKEINNKSLCEKWTKSSAFKKKTKLGLIICKGCQTSTLLVNKPRNIQILTCLSFYLLAQETGAVRVLGSHWEHICLSTLQPIHHIERLSCGVVISDPTVSLGVDEIGHSAFWTWVPAYCDVIVSAICHSSHTSGWADD